jgi:hypothetical protein
MLASRTSHQFLVRRQREVASAEKGPLYECAFNDLTR